MSALTSLVTPPERAANPGKMLMVALGNDSAQLHGASINQESPILNQKVVFNHSIQLVKMQSDLHEICVQRAKDAETNVKLVREMQCLHARVTELKGIIAGLTIELHVLRDDTTSRLQAYSIKPEDNKAEQKEKAKKKGKKGKKKKKAKKENKENKGTQVEEKIKRKEVKK